MDDNRPPAGFAPTTMQALALFEVVQVLRQVGDEEFVREALLEHMRTRQSHLLSWTEEAPPNQ